MADVNVLGLRSSGRSTCNLTSLESSTSPYLFTMWGVKAHRETRQKKPVNLCRWLSEKRLKHHIGQCITNLRPSVFSSCALLKLHNFQYWHCHTCVNTYGNMYIYKKRCLLFQGLHGCVPSWPHPHPERSGVGVGPGCRLDPPAALLEWPAEGLSEHGPSGRLRATTAHRGSGGAHRHRSGALPGVGFLETWSTLDFCLFSTYL